MPELLHGLVRRRRLGLGVERVVFALVLQRILASGSDRAGAQGIPTVYARGCEAIRLPQDSRALRVLWPHKARIEQALSQKGLDLFARPLDLVFFDTTSLDFEGQGPEGLARLGHSQDHRPDHPQVILGVLMRRDGLPIACEVWPGNTADLTRLTFIATMLRQRFAIERVVVVCDRGMVSRKTLDALTAQGFQSIVGMKLRGLLEVWAEGLARAGRYQVVRENLPLKGVRVEDRRDVVCPNPEEAAKDRADREKILAALEQQLAQGGIQRLIPHRGDRRFLGVRAGRFELDTRRAHEHARYDGKSGLRTTTDPPAEEVALASKHRLWIERLFRELRPLLKTCPIYHHRVKDHVKGHLFGCFLAPLARGGPPEEDRGARPEGGVGRSPPRPLAAPGPHAPPGRPPVLAAHRAPPASPKWPSRPSASGCHPSRSSSTALASQQPCSGKNSGTARPSNQNLPMATVEDGSEHAQDGGAFQRAD